MLETQAPDLENRLQNRSPLQNRTVSRKRNVLLTFVFKMGSSRGVDKLCMLGCSALKGIRFKVTRRDEGSSFSYLKLGVTL